MNNQKEDEIEKMNAALSTIETGYRTPEFESGFKEGWKERGYAASTPSEQGSDGWIDVKDKVPESGEYVLCYLPIGHMVRNSWEAWTDQNEKWFKDSFTHWRPLPTPPQSKE